MDNRQNNHGITGSIINVDKIKEDDYNYRITNNDGFYYFLCIHKYGPLFIFARGLIESKSKMLTHYSWVDEKAMGRYINLVEDQEAQAIPAQLVRAKYSQILSYFDRLEDVESKLRSGRAAAEKQELKSEINSHLIRLVNLLFHDLANNGHAAEAIENKLSLIIRNNPDNYDMFIPKYGLTKNDEWLHLTFSNNSYYIDATATNENHNILYRIALHKTLNHVIFARATSPEFKTTVVHHLYISQDNGLGRYKVQSNEGAVSKQFFVPAGYVEGCHNIFRGLFNDFKKLHDPTDVFSKQTIWCKLQDDAIHITNYILGELERDLKQEIDKSLDHHVMSLASTIRHPNNFDDFYNKVVEREKRIRLQNRENTYSNSLIIFNKRNRTAFIIHINNLENDLFYLDEKIRILLSKYDPDYYVMVSEGWMPKNFEIQQRISSNYRHGNITKLPSHERTETLIFIAKTKNSSNGGPDKSEVYEIIRERSNDEMSRILELRKFDEGRLDFAMEYHQWV